jgi:uncharacterized repeat protein (TIGR01451 family)
VNASGSASSTITGPDLTISKSPIGGAINAGQNAVFTITVSNNGANATGNATNVIISDQLPNTLSWSLTPPVTGCSISGGQLLTCNLPGPIAPAGSVNIIVTAATTTENCPASILNTANITGFNDTVLVQGIPSNQASIACSQVTANLQATKTDGVNSYTPGTQVVYTISVSNPAGPSAALGSVVSDTRPAQITTWSWVCSPAATGGATGCTGSGGFTANNFTDTVDLPVGGTIFYTVTANTDPAATGPLVNTVTVTPPNGQAGQATDTDAAAPIANLGILKTNGGTTVVFGASTTYTITVTNNGPSNVTGAPLIDPAVTGLNKTNVSCGPVPGACAAPPSIASLEAGFALPLIVAGGTYQITVTATVTSTTGSVSNTAKVTPPGGTTSNSCTPGTRDAADQSCSSTDTDAVNYFTLSVQKTASSNSLPPGSQLTFTVTVTNNGPAAADGTIITDILPSGFSGSTAVCQSGPNCPGGDVLAQLNGAGVTVNPFPSGTSYVFVITGTFNPPGGSVTNTGTACPPSVLAGQVSCGNGSTTVVVPSEEVPVPTLGEYALIALMLMMAALGTATVRRRRR